jgi:glucose-1-phosphate adenylyltransferase
MRNDEFVTVVPPQMMKAATGSRHRRFGLNIELIRLHNPDRLVFGADHVYRMDLQQMVDFHRERRPTSPSRRCRSRSPGVVVRCIVADRSGACWSSRSRRTRRRAVRPTRAYTSMGNYLFNTDVMVEGRFRKLA